MLKDTHRRDQNQEETEVDDEGGEASCFWFAEDEGQRRWWSELAPGEEKKKYAVNWGRQPAREWRVESG